jgi:thiol reductant ABC exporter CydD subunit
LLALDPHAGRLLWAAVGVAIGGAVAAIAVAIVLSSVIAGVVETTLPAGGPAPLLITLALLIVARATLLGVSDGLAGRAAVHLVAEVRGRLTGHLLALGPAFITGERSGEVASTLVDGLEATEAWVRSFRPAALLANVVPVVVLVVVLVIDPPSAVVLLVTGPVLVLLLGLIGRRVGPATAARAADLRWMQGYFADMLHGIGTLRAFGRSHEQAERIREIGFAYGDSTMTVLRTAFQASLVLEWGAAVAMAFIAVELSLRLMGGGIGFAATLAVLIIAPEFFLPLRRFAATYHEGAAGREAAARILEILDTPPPRSGIAGTDRGLPVELPRSLGDIVLHDVRVTYPGRAEPALRDVDLVLPAGRRTAIVGESGAGKSTLARLLLRFVDPDAGRITVGGEALADMDVHAWRGRIAYVPQSPHLFHGTVAENIRLARPDATHDEVAAAAGAAGATAFIEDLPDGLDTPIGEDGVRLSGGQRQRIAVARAFLRDADLVVLDEPTAHLDPDAEASVAAAVDRLGRGRTVVVISHRSAVVEGADVVIELDHGRVVR